MASYGLLIDYNYCTGCHTCEVACQQELALDADKCGIWIKQMGPFQVAEDKWEFDNIPVPTDFCDLCSKRTAKGKLPTCVQHCQADCMKYGEVCELAKQINSPKQVLFAVK